MSVKELKLLCQFRAGISCKGPDRVWHGCENRVESPASTTVRRAQKRRSTQNDLKSHSFAILGTRNKIRTHNPEVRGSNPLPAT
jgi:hypothetical protein